MYRLNMHSIAEITYCKARAITVFRANPYPEVTDQICRLPLPTLFYRLETLNLGDLLRIRYRLLRVCVSLS
jgi:hypothetical protein